MALTAAAAAAAAGEQRRPISRAAADQRA